MLSLKVNLSVLYLNQARDTITVICPPPPIIELQRDSFAVIDTSENVYTHAHTHTQDIRHRVLQ